MHGNQWSGLGSLAAMAALGLSACGGGGGSPGVAGLTPPVAAAPAQLASGVVTGFGSVYVDGVKLEDTEAQVLTELADGSTRNVALQLGQRVRASHDGNGRASRLVVDSAVIGSVASVASDSLVVAGQPVTVNADATLGPVTVFGGGLVALGDLVAGDLVEVHGSPVLVAGSWTLRATRIEKLGAVDSVKVTGSVSQFVAGSSGKTFQLGALTVDFAQAAAAGRVRPSETAIADGVVVRVFAAPGALVGNTLTASAVRRVSAGDDAEVSARVQWGGLVSDYDVTTPSFKLQGTLVRLGSADVSPTGAALANDAWVKVDAVLAADGALDATRVEIRQASTDSGLASIKLIGPLSGLVDPNSFIVRDVPVDASAVSTRPGCGVLADGAVVSVVATMQAGTDVVRAESVSCELRPPVVVRPVGGIIATVNAAAQIFSVTNREGASSTVRWTADTAFVGADLSNASGLVAGLAVHAEGVMDGASLVAKVISVHGARPVDRFREQPQAREGAPTDPQSAATAARAEALRNWTEYRARPPRR